jgi:hypothetical protein
MSQTLGYPHTVRRILSVTRTDCPSHDNECPSQGQSVRHSASTRTVCHTLAIEDVHAGRQCPAHHPVHLWSPLQSPLIMNNWLSRIPASVQDTSVGVPSVFIVQAISPLFLLFLPLCMLGPAAISGTKSHKFHIESRKDGAEPIKTGSLCVPRMHGASVFARTMT